MPKSFQSLIPSNLSNLFNLSNLSNQIKMKIINPATEEVIIELKEYTAETLLAKFNKLQKAQPAWAAKPLAERIAVIKRFSDLLLEEKDELAKTLTSEMGKPLNQSNNELNGARTRIKFFVENSEKYLADEWVVTEGDTKEKISYEPLGVICNISAWNYPYLVGVNAYIPALIAGNTVMYKPSEYTTLTGLHVDRLLKKAGVPDEVFQVGVGAREVGEALLNMPFNGYFFTGSYKTGKYIAEKVAGRMVPVGLELGGKDPMYVADDITDIAKVAASAVEGVVYNNGQSCCAVERIYVHENIFDKFVDAYVAENKRMKVGNPLESPDIGAMSRKEQLSFLDFQVKDAVAKGAKLLDGGKIKEGKGYFFEPAVLVNVNHSMSIMKEESFGPIVGIQKVRNDEEALQLMQDTEYGLTAAVYSSNKERAENLMRKIDTGTVYWNCCDRVSPNLPWSGRKHSGIGSTLSHIGIRAFTHPKAFHLRG